ncbi:MAG: hypothetical protein K8F91_17510 [Candidatus Obscuribacterales bacterium]|nr:hypothetical protein [Candidatus Obscuribacterales bacterium]
MELSPQILTIIIIALLVLPPVVLFRPLINSLSDRISGKKSGTREIGELVGRVKALESELSDLRGRFFAIEESQDFSRKLLEDMKDGLEKGDFD